MEDKLAFKRQDNNVLEKEILYSTMCKAVSILYVQMTDMFVLVKWEKRAYAVILGHCFFIVILICLNIFFVFSNSYKITPYRVYFWFISCNTLARYCGLHLV